MHAADGAEIWFPDQTALTELVSLLLLETDADRVLIFVWLAVVESPAKKKLCIIHFLFYVWNHEHNGTWHG